MSNLPQTKQDAAYIKRIYVNIHLNWLHHLWVKTHFLLANIQVIKVIVMYFIYSVLNKLIENENIFTENYNEKKKHYIL